MPQFEATCWHCGMTVRKDVDDDGELARLRSELRQARARLAGLANAPGSIEFYRAASSEWHRLSRKLVRELVSARRENERLDEENRGLRQFVAVPPSRMTTAPTYVDGTGLTRIPLRVRTGLGILNGGGVQFVEEEGRPWFRLMTDRTFFDETGLGREEGSW